MVELTRLVVGKILLPNYRWPPPLTTTAYIVGYGTMPDNSTHAFLATPGSRMKAIGYVPYLLLLD